MDNIDKAAEALVIQMVCAEALLAALDGSGDLRTGQTMDDLMIEKFMDLDPLFEEDLDYMGIEIPLLVEVEGKQWILEEGHHRLAWALDRGVAVPVCFLDIDVEFEAIVALTDDDRFYDHSV